MSQVKKGLVVEMGNKVQGKASTSQVRSQGRPSEKPEEWPLIGPVMETGVHHAQS